MLGAGTSHHACQGCLTLDRTRRCYPGWFRRAQVPGHDPIALPALLLLLLPAGHGIGTPLGLQVPGVPSSLETTPELLAERSSDASTGGGASGRGAGAAPIAPAAAGAIASRAQAQAQGRQEAAAGGAAPRAAGAVLAGAPAAAGAAAMRPPPAREPLRPVAAAASGAGEASGRGAAPVAAAQPAAAQAQLAMQQQAALRLQQQQQQQQAAAAAAPPPTQLRPKEDAQTVYVRGVRYTKLECVGRGGSSKVFKVRAEKPPLPLALPFIPSGAGQAPALRRVR